MRVESHLRVDRNYFLAIASYGITIVRLLIAALGGFSILLGADVRVVIGSIAIVMAFDYFDGATFEKSTFSAVKEWRINRRIADSISDRLVIQIICIPLLFKNSAFIWFYLPILAREIAVSGYVSRAFANGIVVYPRAIAKTACAMVGVAVVSFLAFTSGYAFITTAVMIILSAFALLDYSRRVEEYKAPVRCIGRSTERLEEVF